MPDGMLQVTGTFIYSQKPKKSACFSIKGAPVGVGENRNFEPSGFYNYLSIKKTGRTPG
jgi:hypothetical protein